MLSSSNGLGPLAFTQRNAGSNPADSTKYITRPIDSRMYRDIKFVEPYRDFFKTIQSAGGYIAGGFARWLAGYSLIPYGDIDIFCLGESSYKNIAGRWSCNAKTIAGGLIVNAGERVLPYMDEQILVSDITYIKNENFKVKIQFIYNKNYECSEDIINDFDISVCCAYLDFENEKLYYTEELLQDELNRNLRIINIRKTLPIDSIQHRIRKYLEKGYKIYLSEILRFEGMLKDHPEFSEGRSVLEHPSAAEERYDPKWFHKKEEYDMMVGLSRLMQLPENLLGG